MQKETIGWREFVALPKLGLTKIQAKIDTGARSSALHAVGIKEFKIDDALWVEFEIPLGGLTSARRISAEVIDQRAIKNTSGIPDDRYLILTELVLGARAWTIELSLADRENMGFSLILGRTAIRRRRLLVDPGRSFLLGAPLVRGDAISK